jgi:hypothetical protein
VRVDAQVGRESLENLDRRRSVLLTRDNVQTGRLAEKNVLRHVGVAERG